MRKLSWLSSLILLTASSCVTIQNGNTCTVAGKLSAGGICSHITDSLTSDLSFNEMIDMIEAQPARKCVPVPGFNICADDQTKGIPLDLPLRGGAIIMPASDATLLLTELQISCRMLGKRCSYQTKAILKQNNMPVADDPEDE